MVQVTCACQKPTNRGYYDVANFLAPYDNGYYQNGAVFGLGSNVPRDVEAAASQVPRWVWVLSGLGLFSAGAYGIYQARKHPTAAQP
jgi:hypothetical protein